MITDYGLAGAAGTSMEDTTIVLHLMLAHESYRETLRWIADAGLPDDDVQYIRERSGPDLLKSVHS